MHFQRLALSLAFGLCACDSGITVPSESVSAQTPPLDAAMPMESAAISGSAVSGAVAEPPSPSPLVCPSCKPNVAANALIDLSNCSTPGRLSFALVGTLDGVFGSLRIQLDEYPDEAAAQGDPLRPVEIYERFFAQFSHDHCEGRGRSAALAEPLPELAGATAQQLYAEAQMALAGAAPFDGTWLDGSPGRGSIELGAPLSEQVCVELRPREPWIVHYAGPAQARSEDRSLEVAQASFEVAARPYSRVIERVYATGDLGNAVFSVRWPDGLDHATEGWIESVEPHGQLAWPPCTHAESCDPNNPCAVHAPRAVSAMRVEIARSSCRQDLG